MGRTPGSPYSMDGYLSEASLPLWHSAGSVTFDDRRFAGEPAALSENPRLTLFNRASCEGVAPSMRRNVRVR